MGFFGFWNWGGLCVILVIVFFVKSVFICFLFFVDFCVFGRVVFVLVGEEGGEGEIRRRGVGGEVVFLK